MDKSYEILDNLKADCEKKSAMYSKIAVILEKNMHIANLSELIDILLKEGIVMRILYDDLKK
jgi:hypothetical protein